MIIVLSLLSLVVYVAVFAGIGYALGAHKRRPKQGMLLCVLLGVFGIVIMLLLPERIARPRMRTRAEIALLTGQGLKPISTEIGSMTLTTQLRLQVPTQRGAVLMLSDSRRFWWDGRRWWDGHSVAPPDADRSPDGLAWWDGEQWRPVVEGT